MRTLPLLVMIGLATACGEPALQDQTAERLPIHALAGLPLPPGAGAVSTAGSGNTVEITLVSDASADSIASFYRSQLLGLGWDLRVDSRLPDGGINLHAVLGDRPVWILVYARQPAGSRFSVIAGVRDSTPAR